MQEENVSQQVEQLEHRVQELEKLLASETNRLRKIIGSWRRKVTGKGAFRESYREGYSAVTGMHYRVEILDLPVDLPIAEVLTIIKNEMVEEMYPYRFKQISYSQKFKAWLLESEKELNFDMSVESEFLEKYYQKVDNSFKE